jgi:putative ABC transport system permease protein
MPEWKKEVLKRLAGLKLAPAREAEIVEELSQHLEDRFHELVSHGVTEDKARRVALAELGEVGARHGVPLRDGREDLLARGLRHVEREVNQEPVVAGGGSGRNFFASLWQDLRYGFRQLQKNPGFTAAAVLTLALGIGANTAIFGVMDAMLLRPLPYPRGNQLVTLWERNISAGAPHGQVSAADFYDWQKQSRESFSALTAFAEWRLNLSGTAEPERLAGALVTPDFFSVLGVAPAQGRSFVSGEDDPARAGVAIVSDGLWRRLFGPDARLAQQTLTLNGSKTLIVGVMPPDFSFPSNAVEVWVPLSLSAENRNNREGRWLKVLGRLKNEITVQQAQEAMNVIARRIEQDNPHTNAGWGVELVPLREQQVGNLRARLWVMFGAVGLLLLVACTNVASLLLARAAERKHEIAVRAAIGATRTRLIRQLVTEHLLLAVAGGGCGILLAHWILLLAGKVFVQMVPGAAGLRMDQTVLGFAVLLSAGSVALCGLVPALRAAKVNLSDSLKSGRRLTAGNPRARQALVAAQIAVSYVLLVGAGLLGRSLMKLLAVDPGFETRNTLAMDLNLPRSRYASSPQQIQFAQQVLRRIEELPGVEKAGIVSDLPMRGNTMTFRIVQEGQNPQAGDKLEKAGVRWVTADYFAAMKMAALSGRLIRESDNANSPPVAVVNRSMLRRLWPGGLPAGARLRLEEDPRWFSVVGVVNDVHQIALGEDEVPAMYLPYLQKNQDWLNWMTLVVHTSTDPEQLVPAIRTEIWSVDKDQPVARIESMQDYVAESVALPRYSSALASGFSLAALLITVVGLYGVMSYSVSQRRQEIGVRAALGAGSGEIRRLILWQGGRLALAGLAVGIVVALGVTRWLQSLLFKTSVTDPLTLAGAALLLTLVALAACFVPARRATKVDPMVALRYE